ncbi:MAG: hypothetical protein K6F56_00095 [Oscillospiraceae bacterium]|nr:hypothetical protein [Oscillospiraceae bacterium]
MKKTQIKDALRNIRANKVSYLSIVVIAMLAALAYLGITYSAAALSRKASNYYTVQRMWDIEVVSNLLMDEEDLDEIRALPGVSFADPVWQVSARLVHGDSKEAVSVLSTERELSKPERMIGRTPKRDSECMVEQWLADRLGIRAGDTITVQCGTLAGINPLKHTEYTVTGVFRHPDHISFQVQVTPYILVKEAAFDQEELDGAFMKARVVVKDAPQNRYSAEYLNAVGAVQDAINAISSERGEARSARLRNKYQEQIDDGQRQLDEAEETLRAAREKLDRGQRELEEAAEKLRSGKTKLDDGLAELKDSQEQLNEMMTLAQMLRTEGVEWAETYITEQNWPDVGISFEDFRQYLEENGYEVTAWVSDLALAKLRALGSKLEAARIDWYYAGEEYLDGVTQYDNAKKQLDEGEREYADGLAKWNENNRKLQEARDKLAQIGKCRWIVLNNEGNGGYVFARTAADNLASLSSTFSLIFVAVAALVIYATVGRIVEEQSKLVGATKAMGLYNREVFAKYLLFGVSGTLLGVLLGVLLAYLGIQKGVLKAYSVYFTYGEAAKTFLPQKTLLVALGGLVLSAASVWLACSRLLKTTAIKLMQGDTLTSKLKKAKGRAGGSLYTRLIYLNMRTDLKRVIVTIVSVAGCCILLMIGFTLKYSLSRVGERQFDQIIAYDLRLLYDADDEDAADPVPALEKALRDQGAEFLPVYYEDRSFSSGNQINACTLIVAPADRIGTFYCLRDVKTKEVLTLPESGVLIPLRMQEVFGIGPGDVFQLNDSELMPCDVQAAGIFENYFSLMAVCSPEAYKAFSGEAAEDNCFLVRLNGADPAALEKAVSKLPGFVSLDDAKADRARFVSLTKVLNLVIVVMIAMSGLMAFFILLNLSNTFITQRSRELTIMRINGFTTGECKRYVAFDLAVTTVLGIVLGLVVGAWLGYRVTLLMEQPNIMYVRDPDLRSFVFSFIFTALISVGINSLALRKIKRLKLSDLA